MDAGAHRLLHRAVDTLAGGQRAGHDVAFGDGADQAIVLADRQQADIHFLHGARRVLDGVVRGAQTHMGGHVVGDFKGGFGHSILP